MTDTASSIRRSRSERNRIAQRTALPEWRIPDRQTVIEGVAYKVASTRQEREAAFRLVYEAYTGVGLMEPNAYGMRVTPYHLLPTSEVFVAILDGKVICTLSLIGDG